MTVRHTARTAAAVTLALALAGCSVSGTDAPEEAAVGEPTPPGSAAAALLTPLEEAPRDSRTVNGDGFSLRAPGEFTESARPGPADVEMTVLSTDATGAGAVAEVVAYGVPAGSEVDVEQEMDVLVTELRELRGAADITSGPVEWPGAETAVAVSWTQETAVSGGSVTESFVQLTVQDERGASATVIAVAPRDELEGSGVVDVLRTFRLDSA